MIPIVVGAVVLVAIVAGVLLLKKKKTTYAGADVYRQLLGNAGAGGSAAGDSPEEAEPWQNLRVKLMYQYDKIESAIELERERKPGAKRAELMRAAIARWERDNQ